MTVMDEISSIRVHTCAEVEAMSEVAKVELILALEARLCVLEQRLRELEARVGLNSRNSSKPPSSDGPAKPIIKSLREKSGRPPGGQPGHEGTTLRQVATPEHVEMHWPHRCACGCDLAGQPVTRVERYQVFDLPEPRMVVTEHRVNVKICPACEAECKGALPPEVSAAPAQYGPRVRALVVYLRVYQLLPYERLSALCRDAFGLSVSKATIEAAEVEADGHLQPFVEEVAAQLRAAPVAHADETGLRVEGRTRWLHVLATEGLTLYHVDDKRGREAMEAQGVLPQFTGRLVHDCWAPYFAYEGCTHGLCGAHLLRELKFAHEEQRQAWAFEMSQWLLYLSELRAARSDAPFSAEGLAFFEAHYEAILARGAAELPPPPERVAGRGRLPKSKSANLHERLVKHRDAVLRFVHDPQVPFTNNLAEQAVRMAKVQQKISGCLRTVAGARRFARLRSYVSTLIKQHRHVLTHIAHAITGIPWIPHPSEAAG
jgi:transposase